MLLVSVRSSVKCTPRNELLTFSTAEPLRLLSLHHRPLFDPISGGRLVTAAHQLQHSSDASDGVVGVVCDRAVVDQQDKGHTAVWRSRAPRCHGGIAAHL